jgi:branched-chain amino acid transport system substrate-binding protein
MIGPFISTFTLPAAPIYTEAKIPSIVIAVSSAFTPQVSPYGFVGYYDASLYTKFMIDYVMDTMHAKSAAIISSNGALDKSAVEGFQKSAAARNFTITGVEQHDFRQADVTANLLNLRRGNPDVLIQQASTAEEGGLIIKTLGEIGWKVPVASHTAVLFAPTWMKMAGPDIFKGDTIHGLTFGSYLACKDSPQGATPFAKFLQRVKEVDPQNFDRFLQLSMTYYYDAIRLMFAAIDATKSVDGPTVAAWIENNAASFPSITGPMSPTKTNHFLFAGNAMWMVTRPDVRRPDGLLNKPGC